MTLEKTFDSVSVSWVTWDFKANTHRTVPSFWSQETLVGVCFKGPGHSLPPQDALRVPQKTDAFAARHLGKIEGPDVSSLSVPQIAQTPAFLPWPALPLKSSSEIHRGGSQNRHAADLLCASHLSWTGLRAERNKVGPPSLKECC